MTKIPERFIWATDVLGVKPTDTVLEIGCGAGLLAEQIASRLTSGQLIAIDTSFPMLEKAKQRNKRFIDNRLSKFIGSDLLNAELPASYFDAIVAFNVNFFWKDPVKELLLIKQCLKPTGKLCIFHQAPFQIDKAAAEPVARKLINNGFAVFDIQLEILSPSSAICIIAKPDANCRK